MNRFLRLSLQRIGLSLLLAAGATAQSGSEGESSNSSLTSYDGPDIPGRGSTRVGSTGNDAIPIQFSAFINGTYDSLIGGYTVTPSGDLYRHPSYGVEAGLSARGQKRYRHSVLGLNYYGNYNHYTSQSSQNGSNHALSLGYSRRLNRRWELNSTNVASLTNRVIGNPLNQVTSGIDLLIIPNSELFDSQIFFAQTTTGVSYLLNSRWQIQMAGTGGVVRRKARGLADVNSYGGQGSIYYRWNRRTTLSIAYLFNHYDFGSTFGESNIHGVTVTLAKQIGRGWTVRGSVSGYRQQTIGIRQVTLDPVIAALLGQSTGYEAFDSNSKLAGYGGALTRMYRRSVFGTEFNSGVNPGNGLFLTSRSTMASAYYSHMVARVWNLSVSANFTRLGNLTNAVLRNYDNTNVRGSVSRRLTADLYGQLTVEYGKYTLGDSEFDRKGSRVQLGVRYQPDKLPFLR